MISRTAFVASTLPARYLLDNWKKLGINRIVCGSPALVKSYTFIQEKNSLIKIISVPSNRKIRLKFLRDEVQSSLSGVVIFHECCWSELDLALLEIQPEIFSYPCVTLDGWRKLTKDELKIHSLLEKILKVRTKNILRLLINSVKFKNNFDFYEVIEDNDNNISSFVMAIKGGSFKHLHASNECLDSRKFEEISNDNLCKAVILVTATDVVSNDWQKNIFNQVALLCKKYGYEILVKDHPNPNSRLNLLDLGKELSPYTPFEVMEEKYRFKIGLFSSTLTFHAKKSISIANLFQPFPEKFIARKNHLMAIPGGESISYIDSLEALELILKS
jgi:hypothetical protein